MKAKGTLNAIRPTMTPSAKKMNAMINQITPQTVLWIRIYSLSGVGRPTSGWTATTDLGECTCIGSIDLTADGIVFTKCEPNGHTHGGRYTPMTSHRTYRQDMTPTNNIWKASHSCAENRMLKILTKYLRPTESATNQNRIITPVIPTIKTHDLGDF